jgi:uncharacterized protein (DUF362 family)
MIRRDFLSLPGLTSAALLSAADLPPAPSYRIVTPYRSNGMGDRYPRTVARVQGKRCIDTSTSVVDRAAVAEMLQSGMKSLTGASNAADAWRAFFQPSDVVGIKVNASGSPNIRSTPELVWEIVTNLQKAGLRSENITIFERFPDQMATAGYRRGLTAEVATVTADSSEAIRDSLRSYDPRVYVEADFFGEDDTRSNLMNLVTSRFQKIINVPNMKEHGAAGVTGCLKNMAYGCFHNVARTHQSHVTHTRTYIGTLASVEPLRSRTVLHIMDGLKGVWHGGPFLSNPRFAFFPRQLTLSTDPVAADVLLLELIEDWRRRQGAVSLLDRSPSTLDGRRARQDPNFNRFIREPGHIAYAASLGLGEGNRSRIIVRETEAG